jgi:hypothetical protein
MTKKINDTILDKIKELGMITGDTPADIAKKLDTKPDLVRFVIKQINKSHCNGAPADYQKYSKFVVKDKFGKNDFVSIIYTN